MVLNRELVKPDAHIFWETYGVVVSSVHRPGFQTRLPKREYITFYFCFVVNDESI